MNQNQTANFIIKYFILFSLCLAYFNTNAQYENVWSMGNVGIDFNTNPPTIIQKPGFVPPISNFGEAAASICDANGDLLFFTEGTFVYDKNNNLMPNGNNLNPIPSTTIFSATSSSSQGALIVPDPGNTNRFYVFSMYSLEQQINQGKLYYSVVDMSLNGGLGDVVISEKGILLSTNNTERLTAVKGNHCNIWIVTVSTQGVIRSFNLNQNGLDTTPVLSNIGLPYMINFTGKLAFSPNREKLAIGSHSYGVQQRPYLQLANFNPSTGVVSNFEHFLIDTPVYGIAFSSNSQYLYFLSHPDGNTAFVGKLFAFAGNQAAIASSTIAIQQPIQWASDLKRAPDDNIYFTHQGGVGIPLGHSRIENANSPGMASNVNIYALSYSYANGQTPWPGMGLPNVIITTKKDTITRSDSFKVCRNNNKLQAFDTSGYDYVWSDGNQNHTRLDIVTSGTYWVNYTTDGCTYYSDTLHVTIKETASTVLSAMICEGDKYEFENQTLYLPGQYTETYTSENGCDSIVTLMLNYFPKPNAQFSQGLNPNVCLGDTIYLTGPHANSYEWQLNGKYLSQNKDVSLQVIEYNSEISLTVIDSNGCAATAAQQLLAAQCCEIIMPNAFSPNGDGINDVFKPIFIKPCVASNITLIIYNRWGQQVYYGINNYAMAGWDGTFGNQFCDIGVYGYILSYTLKGEKVAQVIKGDITLIK